MKHELRTQSSQVIVRKLTGGYREFRIPGITCVQDTVFLTCEGRAEDKGDYGDIDVKVLRQEPDGSFREVLCIGESHLPNDEGKCRTHSNGTLVPDGNRLHLLYQINYGCTFIVTSEDLGETWTEPREITAAFRAFPFAWTTAAAPGPGHGIALKSGRLVVPVWMARGENHPHWPSVAGCIYSDDHGATWHAGAMTEGIESANETSIVELPDGRLLFNFRNRELHKHRILAISSDGGESFESYWTPDELVDPWCFGAIAMAPDGSVLFANCESTEKRVNVTVKVSRDEGKTWKKLWEIDPIGGYVDLAVINGRAWVFYERLSYEDRIHEELVLAVSEPLE